MIHYHGTPLTPRAQLMRMAGRHFCVPFPRPEGLASILSIAQSVMFDNGAFSAFTRGEPLDVQGYYTWLEKHLAPPHWAVIPDVIGGTVEEQRELLTTWPFHVNHGAPVWHLNEPIEHLLDLCEDWPRVCFGSAGEYWEVGTDKWAHRMDEAFNALASEHRVLPWIHGLRMLGQATERWPLASADSTNVAQNFKRDGGCAECKAARIDVLQPAPNWKTQPLQTGLFP